MAWVIFSCSLWDPFLDQGLNPSPLPWKPGVLASGPPGKSQYLLFCILFHQCCGSNLFLFISKVKFHCMNIPSFVFPLTCWWKFELFLVWDYYEWSAMNICVQAFVCKYVYILEKEMAAHSSILALRIPWTEEPDRPQSMELDTTKQLSYLLTASVCTHTHTHTHT